MNVLVNHPAVPPDGLVNLPPLLPYADVIFDLILHDVLEVRGEPNNVLNRVPKLWTRDELHQLCGDLLSSLLRDLRLEEFNQCRAEK